MQTNSVEELKGMFNYEKRIAFTPPGVSVTKFKRDFIHFSEYFSDIFSPYNSRDKAASRSHPDPSTTH